MGRYASRKKERRIAGKTEGKRPLGKRRCRCVDNTKMDLA
jgi:hypothetical protein